MKSISRQFGFSLVEVMFAVVILTLGLIFVASYFPVGLHMSREVLEATEGAAANHNVEVMLEVWLGDLWEDPCFREGSFVDGSQDSVVALYQPNVRVVYGANAGDACDMVMDDIEDAVFDAAPPIPVPAGQYTQNENGGRNDVPGYIPWSASGKLLRSAIGKYVVPSVSETDKEVRDRTRALAAAKGETYDPIDPAHRSDYLEPAMYETALGRHESWLALVQCLDPRPGGAGNTFKFFIFRLDRRDKKLRYMMEEKKDTYDNPTGLEATEDRVFPTLWRVDLHEQVDPSTVRVGEPADRFRLKDFTTNAKVIEQLLRKGTPIVNRDNGLRYEITDVEETPDGDWQVELDRELTLEEPLQSFWVVAPAVKRTGPGPTETEFAERQPVIDVVERIISF